MDIVETWCQRLRSNGYRLTTPRKAVVETVALSLRALTPQDVYEAARRRDPQLGLVTVYRTLEKLESLGLVQRVHQESGCNAYLPQSGGHSHLIICERCGQAGYFEGDDLELLFTRLTAERGYLVRSHWLQLTGICRDCRAPEGS